MTTQNLLAVFVRYRWSLAAIVLGSILVSTVYTIVAPRVYESSAQVYVSTSSGGSAADLLQGSNFSQEQVQSYVSIIGSAEVLGPVVRDLRLHETSESLAKRVTASALINTVVITITVSDEAPSMAADLANAVAHSFSSAVTRLETPASQDESAVKVTITQPASAPTSASSPSLLLNLALGFAVGCVAATVLGLARAAADTRVRTVEEGGVVFGAPLLGEIPFDAEVRRESLAGASKASTQRAEAFRYVRTNLAFVALRHSFRSVLVTSAISGEGKSSLAVNLALVASQAGRSVLLIDGDLRRPSVASYLGIDGSVGLTNLLLGDITRSEAVQPWGSDGLLEVLPAGTLPPNPTDILQSASMQELLFSLSETVDLVIIDGPPLLPVPDSVVLAGLAQGVIAVVGEGVVHRQQLAKAASALKHVEAHVLGVVATAMTRSKARGMKYEYSYGSAEPSQG